MTPPAPAATGQITFFYYERLDHAVTFDVIPDIFEYTGDIKQRYPYEMVCAAAPITDQA